MARLAAQVLPQMERDRRKRSFAVARVGALGCRAGPAVSDDDGVARRPADETIKASAVVDGGEELPGVCADALVRRERKWDDGVAAQLAAFADEADVFIASDTAVLNGLVDASRVDLIANNVFVLEIYVKVTVIDRACHQGSERRGADFLEAPLSLAQIPTRREKVLLYGCSDGQVFMPPFVAPGTLRVPAGSPGGQTRVTRCSAPDKPTEPCQCAKVPAWQS